tara:strand:- start:73 stop:291 length:219 start_codon:yes stop_codon:yes gene_type:complete
MNSEGDYLKAVNELKEQYNELKEKYQIELNILKQENEFLKNELYERDELVYLDDMFYSTREYAHYPKYVSYK